MGERLAFTFALTGRSSGVYVTQGVALGSGLAGLSARAWAPKKSPPSLCEQSELQCFASDLRRMFAQRLLLLCRHLLLGSKTRRQYHTAIPLHEYYK